MYTQTRSRAASLNTQGVVPNNEQLTKAHAKPITRRGDTSIPSIMHLYIHRLGPAQHLQINK